jgi:CubicO group peptidase (beta-lactamase class C family)
VKTSPRDPDWLETLAIEAVNEHALAGLALGVVRDGALERFVGLGLADAEAQRPVDQETVFRIGSISKTMTAIAVMQLVEEGRVGLDDPVRERLRSSRVEAPPGAPPVTVRNLLTHSSGIGEIRTWSDVARPVIGLASKAGEDPPELAEYYRRGVRADVAPGTKWAYANHGFGLLGLLVQDLRGAPFHEAMRERIFDPLGMEHTDFVRSDRVRDRLAVGYGLRLGGRMKPVKDHEIAVGPAGACYSCTEDMARYVAVLSGDGAPLLRPETFERMLAPQGVPGERLPGMGLAFFVDRVAGRTVAGHDGGWPGFISAMLFVPGGGVGVVAFTNTNTEVAPHVLADRVLRRLLDAPEPADPVVADDPHVWADLTGVYRPARGVKTNMRVAPLIGGEAQVMVRKGHLVVRAQSPLKPLRRGIRLRAADPEDPLVFEAHHGDVRVTLVFERGADGDVASVRAGTSLGGFARLHRRPRATSLRLWSRLTGTATAGAAAAAVVARRRRRARSRSGALGALRRR